MLIPVFLHDLIIVKHNPSVASLLLGVEPLMINAVFCSFLAKGMIVAEVTEAKVFSMSVKSTADPTMIFFSMDYGKCS